MHYSANLQWLDLVVEGGDLYGKVVLGSGGVINNTSFYVGVIGFSH